MTAPEARPDLRPRPGVRRRRAGPRPPAVGPQAAGSDAGDPTASGPHVTFGILWAAATLAATIEGPVWVAVLLAPVAGLAAASTLRSWHGAGGGGTAAASPPPLALLSGAAAAAIVLASAAGVWAALAVGVVAVIGVLAGELKGRHRPGFVIRALLILLPAAAGAGLVLSRAQGVSEGVALVAMISLYDAASYLIGTGARFAVEGPIAGMASIGALTLFLAAMPPFAGDSPWILGGLAALLAPLGPIVARRLTADPSARVPALRRLDSLIFVGPAWAVATAILLHT